MRFFTIGQNPWGRRMRQPTVSALEKLSRLSLGWSLSTGQSAGIQQAASRLHYMTIDLLATAFVDEHDLVVTEALFKNLCQKIGERTCQRCDKPLNTCSALIEDA